MTTIPTPLRMMGAPGSPYTRKMRAVLRYRRVPYLFLLQNSPEVAKLPAAKVPLLPTFYLPDESGEIVPVTDSTPLIRRFEAAFDRLTAEQREVVSLARILRLPHKEIAARMGKSEVAVRSLLSRALVALSAELG